VCRSKLNVGHGLIIMVTVFFWVILVIFLAKKNWEDLEFYVFVNKFSLLNFWRKKNFTKLFISQN